MVDDKLHIPPFRHGHPPGLAYCGAPAVWADEAGKRQARMAAVGLVEAGQAWRVCPACLGIVLRQTLDASRTGQLGAATRNQRLSPAARSAIARTAANARWLARARAETQARSTTP
jgi:hypothetical protein